MSFKTLILIFVLISVGRWVIKSVMQSGAKAVVMKKPEPAAQAPRLQRQEPKSVVARKPDARPVDERNYAPHPTQRQTMRPSDEGPWAWHVILDVSEDAPRSEVLSAVKRRVERARNAGDTAGLVRIARAADAGLRRWQPKAKAAKGPRG